MSEARIAVLVSGGGTNLQALLDAAQAGKLKSGRIVSVISSNPGAFALTRARNAGIPTAVVSRRELGTQEKFTAELLRVLCDAKIDLVVLAGFLSILDQAVIDAYPERILNVHPSLIPAFCGKGYYGLRVHEAALSRGVKVTGATVHFVNEIPDGGRILFQKAVKIRKSDTPASLQRRVMEQAEWKLLPRAVEKVAAQIKREKGKKA